MPEYQNSFQQQAHFAMGIMQENHQYLQNESQGIMPRIQRSKNLRKIRRKTDFVIGKINKRRDRRGIQNLPSFGQME